MIVYLMSIAYSLKKIEKADVCGYAHVIII